MNATQERYQVILKPKASETGNGLVLVARDSVEECKKVITDYLLSDGGENEKMEYRIVKYKTWDLVN